MHSATYAQGSIYVFGGISTITIPESVAVHNDVWSFGVATQFWDEYSADQNACPWPPKPPPPQLFRPATVPQAPPFNDKIPTPPGLPGDNTSPYASSTPRPKPAYTRLAPHKAPPPAAAGAPRDYTTEPYTGKGSDAAPGSNAAPGSKPKSPTSLLEMSSRARHAALGLPLVSAWYEPYKSLHMPRDDLWQYNIGSMQWSQPASFVPPAPPSPSPSPEPESPEGERFKSLRGGSDVAPGAENDEMDGVDEGSGVDPGTVLERNPMDDLSQPLPLRDPEMRQPKTPVGPAARWLHTSVLMDKDKLVIFGGVTHDYALRDDVWTYSLETGLWTCVYAGVHPRSLVDSITGQTFPAAAMDAVTGSGNVPITPREGHTAVVVQESASKEYMLVYGGISSGVALPHASGACVVGYVCGGRVSGRWNHDVRPLPSPLLSAFQASGSSS